MTHPRHDFYLIFLDTHPATPPIASLPPRQVGIDSLFC
jgi:hypothetical protein